MAATSAGVTASVPPRMQIDVIVLFGVESMPAWAVVSKNVTRKDPSVQEMQEYIIRIFASKKISRIAVKK